MASFTPVRTQTSGSRWSLFHTHKRWFPVATDLVLGFLEGSPLAEYGLFFFQAPFTPSLGCGDITEWKSLPWGKEAGGLGQESPSCMAALIAGVREQDSSLARNAVAQMKLDNICLKRDALISKQQEKQLKLLSWSLSILSTKRAERGWWRQICLCCSRGSQPWPLPLRFNSL